MTRGLLIAGFTAFGLLGGLGALRAQEGAPHLRGRDGVAARRVMIGRLVDAGVDLGLRSAADAFEVDLVRLRLLRMETRRWQREAGTSITDEDTFDDWAFGGADGARRFRVQLDKLLDRKLREVKQVFALTEAQERKLRLAGTGDLRRLLDVVEDARREFDRCRTDVKRLVQLHTLLRTVELKVAEGPFEVGSLFGKTLRKMFDGKELVRQRTALRK